MSGACLKSDSMSRYCPVWPLPTLNTRVNNRRLFTTEPSNQSPMSFAVYLNVRRLSMCLSPSSSDKHTKSSPCTAIVTSWFGLWNDAALCLPLGSLLTLHRSGSHNQVARCGKRLEFHTCSWRICQLCLGHTSDDPLREVLCKWVTGLFLENVLCWCRSVSTSMVSLCSTNSPTSWLRQAPSKLQGVALQRTTEKQVELLESFLTSSFCILLHTTSIEYFCVLDPQTCLCPPKSGPTVSCPHPCTLALEQSRRHLRNVPNQSLHVSQPTQDLLADAHRWDHPRISLLLTRFDHTQAGRFPQLHSTDHSLRVVHEAH